MRGFPHTNDRKWKITIGENSYFLCEYNDEITGFDTELHALAPDIIYYGGNAYYTIGKFAAQQGWVIEEVPRAK